MTDSQPRIGFDRFVDLAWCRDALGVACGRGTLEDLNDAVGQSLPGAESRRKTIDILKRLWINPFSDARDFVRRGVHIFNCMGDQSVLPLAWGVSIATYPFFGKTAEITGRLFRLHNDCAVNDVQRRMAEKYGDRDGISRATSRVLQSQASWGAIERLDKGKRMIRRESIVLINDQIIEWLVEAVLRYIGNAVSVPMLQSMAVIYPFVLDQSLPYIISRSQILELRSEGSSNQLVELRATM